MTTPNLLYLNHAGTSWPKPPEVLERADLVLQMLPTEWGRIFSEAHQNVADFLHVERSRLLLTPSCTAALQLGLMDHDWTAGDRVLTSHFEHHALQRSLVKLTRLGVEVITLPRTDDQLLDLDAMEVELKAGDVRMVAITAACNVTGQLLPYAEAVELAHRFGVLALIDGAQIAGWWDLDVAQLGADLFTFAGHKGTQAPWGIGGLYVAPHVGMSCPSAVCEAPQPGAERVPLMPGYCDAGSVNISALAGMSAGCDWLRNSEQVDRLSRARELTRYLSDAVRLLPGVTIHHDVPVERKMPSLAMSVVGRTAGDLAAKLKQHGILTSGGFQCSPQTHLALGTETTGVVRFSFGPGSTQADADGAVMALREISRTSNTPKTVENICGM